MPDFVRQQLHPGEWVLGLFNASLFDHRRKHELRHDKFLLTTERLLYYRSSLVHKEFDQMPYQGITGVRYNRGLRHGEVVIEAANMGLTISRISNDDASFAEKVVSSRIAGRLLVPSE